MRITSVTVRRARRWQSGKHKLKSRTGCLTCLCRRKKCDENMPKCGHCQRIGLACLQRDAAAFVRVTQTNLRALPWQPLSGERGSGPAYATPCLEERLAGEKDIESAESDEGAIEESTGAESHAAKSPPTTKAAARVFSMQILLQQIVFWMLDDSYECHDEAVEAANLALDRKACRIRDVLDCARINQDWKRAIASSRDLQQALFLFSAQHALSLPHSIPKQLKVFLNPVLATTFPFYEMRIVQHRKEVSLRDNFPHVPITIHEHVVVNLVVPRARIPALSLRELTQQGTTISRMLVTQPPCTILDARSSLHLFVSDPLALLSLSLNQSLYSRHEGGVTLGVIHRKAQAVFNHLPNLDRIVFRLSSDWAASGSSKTRQAE